MPANATERSEHNAALRMANTPTRAAANQVSHYATRYSTDGGVTWGRTESIVFHDLGPDTFRGRRKICFLMPPTVIELLCEPKADAWLFTKGSWLLVKTASPL